MKSKTKGLLCGGLVVAACASLVCGLNRLRLNVGAEGNIVTMREGASCFLYQDDAEKSGLKFFACVNRDDYNEFETAYGADRVSAGMLLAPLSGIGSAELTKETKEVSDVSVPKEKFKAVTEGGLQRYEFCGTAEEIAEENYTDEYAARAYIKITAAEDTAALSGYPYSDGSFYIYSDYNAAYARSVYSVSYRAYNDRADSQSAEYGNEVSFQENTSYSKLDEEQRNSLKSRLDKVIGVWEKDGNAYLDTDYYSSPFESVSANGSVVVLPENKPYSGMAYNGRPVTDFAETGKKVSLAKKGGELTLTESGGLQTTKKLPAGTSAYEASVWSRYYNYIAFTGDYGVGTYLDFEFTGDRMPQVMFFANDDENGFGKKLGENYGAIAGYGDGNGAGAEHGQWTANGAKGVLLLSALKETETVFQAFGPNRMFGDVNFGESGRGELFTLSYSAYPLFSSKGLRKMPSRKFNYTVGTFTGTDRKVGIELILKDATTKREIYHVRKSLNLTAEEVGSGHIIVYPPFNEADVSCTIDAVSDPYCYEPSDKSYLDPSATLAGKGFFADPNHASNIRVAEFGHIGFEGNYGVGTYIEFEFTGNNMPDVVLFADEIDGHKTAGERTTDGGKESFDYGMLLTAGLGPCNDVTAWSSEKIYSANYLVYGMIRSGWGWEYGGESHGYTECINAKLLGTGATYTYEDYPLLTHAGLKDNDDTFKYTVGTKYNADGNIVVVVSLMKMNFATGEWEEIENAKGAKYTDLEITTGFKEADIKGTNIIVQAPAVASEWETTVSFRYKEPFTLSES